MYWSECNSSLVKLTQSKWVVNVCQSTGCRGSYIRLWREHRHRFTSVTVQPALRVDVCRLGRSKHPFMSKPRPCGSYQPDHPLRSDRDCRAAAGHSQHAAACGDSAAYRRWLYTKHPQLVQWLGPRGQGRVFFILHWQKFTILPSKACRSRVHLLTRAEEPISLGLLKKGLKTLCLGKCDDVTFNYWFCRSTKRSESRPCQQAQNEKIQQGKWSFFGCF